MDYKNVFTNCAPMELPNGLLTVFNLFNKYFSASRFQVLKTTNINLFSSFCPFTGYYLVTPLGFEPRTPTLKVWCSTN